LVLRKNIRFFLIFCLFFQPLATFENYWKFLTHLSDTFCPTRRNAVEKKTGAFLLSQNVMTDTKNKHHGKINI